MKTCVSLDCPFVPHCKDYNFLVDRGERCEIQEDILYRAKILEKKKNKEMENQKHSDK